MIQPHINCRQGLRYANDNSKPGLRLLINNDEASISIHRLARCIYAETLASSLTVVEQLCVMVKNTGRDIDDIASDSAVFESLSNKSARHKYLRVDYENPGLQMCLRSVRRMIAGQLTDKIMGATRFHRGDVMPDWATSIGSTAEIDNILFYL